MGTSLVVQWLRLHASTAGGTGSIPGGATKIPHAWRCGKKKKTKKEPTKNQKILAWRLKSLGFLQKITEQLPLPLTV